MIYNDLSGLTSNHAEHESKELPIQHWAEADVTLLPSIGDSHRSLVGKNRWKNVELWPIGVFVDDLEGTKYFPIHVVAAIEDPYDVPSAIEKLEEELAIDPDPELPFEETLEPVMDRT